MCTETYDLTVTFMNRGRTCNIYENIDELFALDLAAMPVRIIRTVQSMSALYVSINTLIIPVAWVARFEVEPKTCLSGSNLLL